MKSTMQRVPLSVSGLVRHGTLMHSGSRILTWTGDGVRSSTFGETAERAAQLAHALRELGVNGDQRVGTFMFNNQEHMEAYLAIPSMGAVLHTLNIRLFPEQLAYIVNHAEDHAVIVDASVLPLFARVIPELTTVQHLVVNGPVDHELLSAFPGQIHQYEELIAGRPTTFDWPEIDEDDAAAICYTSGTTGDPKGVAYSHRSIYLHSMELCMAEMFGLTDADLVLTVVPQFHANAWGIPFAALLSGASLLMPDRWLQAEPLATMIETLRPTYAGAVPTIWGDLLRHLDATGQDISSLREVAVGGSAVPPSMVAAYAERYGLSVLHAWGMTEMSPVGTMARPPATATPDEAFAYRCSQGRTPALVEARIVGPDGAVLPWDGESVGEVEVRGPWITGSYLHDPAPEKFHDGWLCTGDVGRFTHNGFLTLTDRSKDVIKSGGEWISSVELENLLMGHPDVIEASVIGIPDERWAERPLATVVLRPGAQTSIEELRDYLAGHVARWQVPEYWTIIDEVPKTSVGKFDKKALRAGYAEGRFDVTTLR